MAIYKNTPPIVTDGLVLNLDAASQRAQPTRNLLTYTTDLTNAAWSKVRCSITASATIAPDGTNTAFAFNMSTGSTDLKRLTAPNTTSAVSGGLYTFSVFVKQNNFSGSGNISAGLQLGNYNSGQTAGTEPVFNVLSNFQPTGSFTLGPASSGSAVDRGVIDVGNGWYRVYTTCNWASSIAGFSTFLDLDNGILTGSQYQGTGIYVWGPQFETGYLSPYQPITGVIKTWPGLTFNQYSGSYNSTTSRPTYVVGSGGSIVFDGAASQMTLGTGSSYPFPYHTYEIWAKTPGTGSTMVDGGGLIAFDYGRLITLNSSGRIICNQYSGSSVLLYSIGSLPVSRNFFDNQWHQIVCSRGASQAEMYVDGMLVNSINSGTAPGWDGLNSWSTMQVLLGDNPNNVTYKFRGSIAAARVYNRQLTQAEVAQNYNALKSRFNLS
jgi:hypothetical protein